MLGRVKQAPRQVYNTWKGLPLVPKVFTAMGAVGATVGTSAALATSIAYLINRKWTLKQGSNLAYAALGGMEAASGKVAPILPSGKAGTFKVQGSLSATGPGVAVGVGDFPLKVKGDLGGGGIMWSFKPEQLSDALVRRGWVDPKYSDYARTYLPPEMYAGMELAPYPIAAGALVDKANLEETRARLRRIREVLKPYTHAGEYKGWEGE